MAGLRMSAIVAASTLALAAGCSGGGEDSAPEGMPPATASAETTTAPADGAGVVVEIAPLPGFRERGTATLMPLGEGTHVALELEGGPGGTQSADIRRGTCEQPGRRPAVRLEDVEGGRSETDVAVPLEQLQSSDYVILVQRSTAEPSRHVACGYLAAI